LAFSHFAKYPCPHLSLVNDI